MRSDTRVVRNESIMYITVYEWRENRELRLQRKSEGEG